MKQASIVSLGALPTFNVLESDPLYYIARYCYEKCGLNYNLAQNNIGISQAETADVTDVSDDLEVWSTAFETWLGNLPMAGTQEGGEPRNIKPFSEVLREGRISRGLPATTDTTFPALISGITSLVLAGSGAAIPAIVVNIAINAGLSIFERWLEGRIFSGVTPDTSELTNLLDEIFIGLKDSERVSVLKEALCVLSGAGAIVGSRIDGLGNLHITINTDAETQDSTWSSAE